MPDDDTTLGQLVDGVLRKLDAEQFAELVHQAGPSVPYIAAALEFVITRSPAPLALVVALDPEVGKWQVVGAARDPAEMACVDLLSRRISDLIDEVSEKRGDDALAAMPSEGTA